MNERDRQELHNTARGYFYGRQDEEGATTIRSRQLDAWLEYVNAQATPLGARFHVMIGELADMWRGWRETV
jgi:hypothetical protein